MNERVDRPGTNTYKEFNPNRFIISGDINKLRILNPAYKNKTIFIFDGDGILIDSPKSIVDDFKLTGINYHSAFIHSWYAINEVAERHFALGKLSEEMAHKPEYRWFDEQILARSKPYPSSKKLVDLAIELSSQENVSVLTARIDSLMPHTREWFAEHFGNRILPDKIANSENKENEIYEAAKEADFVVFIDDSIKNVRAVLDANIKNCIVINVPLGSCRPDFNHPNLIVVERFPYMLQDLYSLYRLMANVAHY